MCKEEGRLTRRHAIIGLMTIQKPQAFVFLGRYGAGKGTQSRLLIETLRKLNPARGVVDIETGAEFRQFIDSENYTASLSKAVVERGDLMPEFMPVYLWARKMVANYTGVEHLVFDGTPRLLMEAKVLASLFPFYGLGKPWVIYLDVDHDESVKRLALRARTSGRRDDSPAALVERKRAYEEGVLPTIEWYRQQEAVIFLDIDGKRPIEEIHADIVKRLGLA